MTIMRLTVVPRHTSALAALVIGAVTMGLADAGTALSASDTAAPDFGYSGDNGPGFWGETSGWEACAGTMTTARQSPIDIARAVPDSHLGRLQLQLHETSLALTNNGHTIEQEYEPGSSIAVNGVVHDLTQFHFHTLSEHTVAGQHAVMELHAVFADPASSNKAVVGMLFLVGRPNRFISELLAHGLPRKSGDVVDVPSQAINLRDALTNTARYYTYPGSLTTPPCAETVTWFVLHDYAQLSREQFEAFRSILGNNFRPLQKRNGRVIRTTVAEGHH
jgi:carbonic anhydrase